MTRILRDPRLGLVWLAARLWVGWQFLSAGWDKTFGADSSAWWGSSEGVRGFLNFASSPQMTTGERPPVAGWYAWLIDSVFLPVDGFFAVAIPLGELLVGIGLIVGLFTGAAAFFGWLMSLSFMLAGALSTGDNPLIVTLTIAILFAGSAASAYGIDGLALGRRLQERRRSRRDHRRAVPLAR